ncbi:Sec-independent protein translocase subunit TatA [Corynebacterium sp. CCUG 70398]|uniref:Sec-independent protein translocase subunit TatA n=1 Tax=Corynebacterium sp. CCUG 70398 TaxID=2823891 RepID=UPI0021086EFC|nr:Sec-independent protein translocase subunit TatA [Corynebacterium sp. CCUG 70398]MCQ4622131.1 Sec-independent protein translocase subunit TatA [Corynebacterium sp. CCUG 70398]
MPNLGLMEILLIVFIILLLFGAAKLPDLARSVGRSARIFKSEVNEMNNDKAAKESVANPQRELTSGAESTQTPNSQQGFWDQPENQQRPTN